MEKQTLFWLFIAIFAITAIITLLGITGVIKTIKEKYLNTLFTALILEVVAAIFVIFQGFDFKDNGANLAGLIAKAGLKAPEKIALQEAFIINNLTQIPKITALEKEVRDLKLLISNKEEEIESLEGDISRYDQNFYSNILKLDDALYQITGNTINISYKPEEKEKIYTYLVKIFGDLGLIKEGYETYNADKTINKPFIRQVYKEFRATYGRAVLDDTKTYIEAHDISRMVGRYLQYRKALPQFQARFNAANN